MTAGLFFKHGVWFGECRAPSPENAKGFFENGEIKREMIKRWGKLTLARDVTKFEENPYCEPQDGFKDFVESVKKKEGYTEGLWGYKQSALYKNAWHEYQPKFVGVRRENVLQANIDRQNMFGTKDPKRVQRMIDLHYSVIDECEVIVKTDEIVKGDYLSLHDAMDYCGIEMQPDIVEDFVEPKLWHY